MPEISGEQDPRERLNLPRLQVLLRLSAPLIILNSTFVVIQITDAWMVGRLGVTALAAITIPSVLLFALVSFGYGFLAGLNALVAHASGARDPQSCGSLAWSALWLSGAAGVISAACLWLASLLFFFHRADSPALAALEGTYLRISLLSLAPTLITNALAGFFFGIQRVAPVVWASLFAVVLNVLASYGLVFGAFGLPELGLAGAAWGTVIATTLETVLLGAYFLSGRNARDYDTRTPKFSREFAGKLLKLGLPAGMQAAVDVLSWGALLSLLLSALGEADLAAGGVLLRLMQFSVLPAEGVAIALLTLVGAALGAGQISRAKRFTSLAFLLNSAFMGFLGIVFYLFRTPIMMAFTNAPEVVSIGAGVMILIAVAQWFDAMNITFLHALQGAGDTVWPSRVNIVLAVLILLCGGSAVILWMPGAKSFHIWFLATLYIAGQGVSFWLRWRSGRWIENGLAVTHRALGKSPDRSDGFELN